MQWMHNIVGSETFPVDAAGVALTVRQGHTQGQDYALWMTDTLRSAIWRMPFAADGTLGRPVEVCNQFYDAFLPLPQGYALVFYEAAQRRAVVKGYSAEHVLLWERVLPDADSLRWDAVVHEDGSLILLYSACNPYDAFRQARVARLTLSGAPARPGEEGKDHGVEILFTVPDEDFPHAQLLVPQPERLVVCARSRGAATVVYFIDSKGELLHDGLFASHPHSRWAVPLCRAALENGDVLMGGYKEDAPGCRRAWICRFDADISALNGGVVGEVTEQAVTALHPTADGGILALCPPWKILRLSPKGFVTHCLQVPEEQHTNSIAAVMPTPDGGCFIAGRSRIGAAPSKPAAWLAKVGAEEFVKV